MLKGRAYDPLKRALDIVASAAGLVLVAPILGVTALLVKKNLGSPVLFRQKRPGRDGKVFTLLKFRSMKDVDPEAGLVEDADRLTEFGTLLRSTSLDELPSLVNVLRGEMSIIGPRPLLVEYLDRYTPQQARRHEVRPGVTGLAQVSGRNEVEWDRKFDLDVEYVDSRSLALDISVLWRTVSSVLRRDGVSAEGHATVAPFAGAGGGAG